MNAVYKRELRSYFSSMIGYIFIAFLLVACGFFSNAVNFRSGYPKFEYVIQNLTFIFLLIVPILTMRSFSEEKSSGTDKLLYSLPLSNAKIVLGKYFAMLTVFLIPTAVMCLYPIVLSGFGEVSFASAYSSIIGFYFIGAALIAIGMFFSSLADNQAIAAIICFAAMLFIYLISAFASLIPSTSTASLLCFAALEIVVAIVVWSFTKSTAASVITGAVLIVGTVIVYLSDSALFESAFPNLLNSVAIYDRIAGFVNGLFDLTSIVFCTSVSVVFLFLCGRSLEKRRFS